MSIPITVRNTQPNREFRVDGEYTYDRSSPVRWVISHLLRYKSFLLGFLVSVVLLNIFNSAIPRLAGVAFDQVIGNDLNVRRLLSISLFILGIVLLRGIVDLAGAFATQFLSLIHI